jgi:hypothetical protein
MTMAEAFNEWMRQCSIDPGGCGTGFVQALVKFDQDRKRKKRPTYGDEAAAYLRALMRQPKRVVGKRKAARRRRR